tara:strand:+ start:10290 stop:11207 length:918 start_codon:yes stop_codon:yes gene_type:complete
MEQDKSNPNDQMPADNKAANDQVFGSSSEFFDKLENEVNGAVNDDLVNNMVQQTIDTGNESPATFESPETVTSQENLQGNSNSTIDWQKRYKDSSREAQKLSAKVKKLTPFEPLLNVMRKDEGLVTHIKDYLKDGGKPDKSVKEELGLREDFHYDQNEALEDPTSDSAKVFNAQVDRAVKEKVDQTLKAKDTEIKKVNAQKQMVDNANAFQKDNNVDPEMMKEVLKKAYNSKLSLEDSYFLLNRNQASNNIANNVRKEVVQQMENVRNIPQSASQTNSADVQENPTDSVFDTLLGQDENVDNLFG